MALSREAAWSYHTLYVWDEQGQTLQPIVSIQEGDRGSGPSHQYRWSADSRALLLRGWGSLPLARWEPELAYIYVLDEKALYRLPACGGAPS